MTDGSPRDRLDSWKQIAAYLGRGVTTVQRWEQDEQLPIHRLPHAKRGSVFAYKHEIDAWIASRAHLQAAAPADLTRAEADPLPAPAPAGPPRRTVSWAWAATAVALVVIATVAWRLGGGERAPSAPSIPRPLANDGAIENNPTVSPDGRSVAYFWRRATEPGLYVKPVAGGAARRLVIEGLEPRGNPYTAWSPRGDLIAFLSDEGDGARGVYVVPAAGGRARRVTGASGIDLCWAPDGDRLGFIDRVSASEPFSVFAVSLSTGERRRLTAPPAGAFGDTYCAFSPTRNELAVARYSSRTQADVFVVGLDGGSVRQITFDFPGTRGLAWTPDGREVVFGSHNGLWRVPAAADATGPPSPVAGISTSVGSPSFSSPTAGAPARLVFGQDLRDVNLWRWDDQGGTARPVVESTWWEDWPAFAPSSRRFAFASNRTGHNEIYVADAAGTGLTQVTFHGGPVVVWPQWAPDESRIAYATHAAGNRDIYVVAPDGSRSTRLTWEPTQEDNPSWSRDGRWIYFRSDRGGRNRLWKIPAAGGQARPVTQGEAIAGQESPDGTRLYFVRADDAPGLWSVPVEGGDESLVLADVRHTFWGVTDDGIAFLSAVDRGPYELRLFRVASGDTVTLAVLPVTASAIVNGFAVTPDARTVLWGRVDDVRSDVMVIDAWRP